MHFGAFSPQLLNQTAGGTARDVGRVGQAGGFLNQSLAQQGHVVSRTFGGDRGQVDVVAQRLKHSACLLGCQGRRSDQGFGQFAGTAGLGGQSGPLTHRMGQHDGQAYRGQGDQGIDGETQRLQLGGPRADLEGQPGCNSRDPGRRRQPGDQIGPTLGRCGGLARSRRRRWGRSLEGGQGAFA